jgi:ABC-2 type transport system ATP-binding protein
MNAISIAGLSVRYGRRVAVDDVSLDVATGAVYALLGRNGAGKSSLVRCVAGQQYPNAGRVTLLGEEVMKHRRGLMQRVGVVGEDPDAPPEMRVRELATFCASLYDTWDAAALAARLRRFGVDGQSVFGELSKGQKKQVQLTLALAAKPELLILDDPTLGLDVVARKSLFDEVISELADRGLTVFVTTHDLAGIEAIADRVAVMKGGRLVLDEELEALKARFRRVRYAAPAVAAQGGAISARPWGGGMETVVSDYVEGRASDAAEVVPMTLEEIFIEVAGEGVQS